MKVLWVETCAACGGTAVKPLLSIPDVPTLCNRLYETESAAVSARRGTIRLAYCSDCGHVTNSGFDPARVDYDSQYESTLGFSPHYQRYASAAAERIIEQYHLAGKQIVEIGCGCGDFLALLCAPGNNGKGYDPSQQDRQYEEGLGSVRIVARNFTFADAVGADLVCCRHVLEHLPAPGHFLRSLRAVVAERSNSFVFFEVPNALFIIDRLSIWDLIYEHVSYFTPLSLLRMFGDAGFSVCKSGDGFGRQYLWVEALADERASRPKLPKRPKDWLYTSFEERFSNLIGRWRRDIAGLMRRACRVAIWGAGAKGVMFTNLLRIPVGGGINCVVDINPRKHGKFMPGTGQPIVAPEWLKENPPEVVLVMNPEYRPEVSSRLAALGIDCALVDLEEARAGLEPAIRVAGITRHDSAARPPDPAGNPE